MESTFKLYNQLKSSYFDLISGDKETQQTKGLGLLLSKSAIALKAFLNLSQLKSRTGNIDLDKISRMIVNCELCSQENEKFRADILIRFYRDEKPYKALLIEAKSINKETSVAATNKQIENYIQKRAFKEIEGFENAIFGITLTKYPNYTNHDYLISITWSDLIMAFHRNLSKNDILLNDYFNFLTNINGIMKFYEKEVFSIPIHKWSREAIARFCIYECPNTDSFRIKHIPLYLAFRNDGGGEMEKLYKVDEIIILRFSQDLESFLEDDRYSKEVREDVRNYTIYMKEAKRWGDLPADEKQVFILSKNAIELKHRPKPQKNNTFKKYYDLADLLNNDIV